MNIFEKRPLSLILCIMLCGFSLFTDSGITIQLTGIAIALVIFTASWLFNDMFPEKLLLIRFACIALVVAISLSIIFVNIFLPVTRFNRTCAIRGEVLEVDHTSAHSSSITIQTFTIDSANDSHKLLVYGSKDELSRVSCGDVIDFSGTIEEFRTDANGFNQRSYYHSRGYSGCIYDVEGVQIISGNDNWSPSILITMRTAISNAFRRSTDAPTGDFLAALIMGERDALDDNTVLNFSAIGITHILALSGMHLVILCEGIKRLLSLFKMKKKTIVVISTLFSLFYMGLTGFSASVVRSAVMLAITNTLFMLSSTHDSYTTLPLSVVIILIFQPYAVYDLSLWLSAFATLGILVFSELNQKKNGENKRPLIVRLLLWIWETILATVFALGATYTISAYNFSTFSVIAPLSTLIFSFPINMLIYLGMLVIALYPIIPAIGYPIVLFTDLIKETVEILASWQWAVISLKFPLVQAIIAVFSFAFFGMLIFKIRKIRLAYLITVCLFCSSLVVGMIQTQIVRHTDELIYRTNESSDVTLIKSDGRVAMVYSGDCTTSGAMADAQLLVDNALPCIDMLILPSYSEYSVRYIESLVADIKVDTVYIPTPLESYEIGHAELIANTLVLSGSNLRLYEPEIPISVGDSKYHLIDKSIYRPDTDVHHIFTVNFNAQYYTYLSNGAAEALEPMARIMCTSSEHLIFGTYGSGYSESYEFGVLSDRLIDIYYSNYLPISKYNREYYENKGVPIKKIDTSSFYIKH